MLGNMGGTVSALTPTQLQSCPITRQVNTSTNLPTKNYFRFKN